MMNGEAVERGPILQVFERPQHPYTKGLLACRPRLDSDYRRLPTVADFMEVRQTDGRAVVVEKNIDARRIHELRTAGRGRLLHPQDELLAMGHPWDKTPRGPDDSAVAEGAAPLLAVKGLKVHFPVRKGILQRVVDHVHAVDGVSFDVYRGQTLGLVGESGCGKTTTGRAIIRLLEPTSGSVEFDGQDVRKLRGAALRRMRSRMQIIFQDPYGSLNPRMTIENALIEPMVIQKIGANRAERRDRAAALLKEVGMSSVYLRRYPHEFSGGQRQRICVARAIAVEPEMIICDECVSALDVSVQAQVLNLLKDLQERRGLTYIFISHDLSVVKFMADMMAVMNAGRFVEFGPSEAIYADPKEEYTKRLIRATPRDDIEFVRERVRRRTEDLDSRARHEPS
jgi:peptide/nickel transport system ATP-binding protein